MYAQLSLYSQLIGSWRSAQRANAAAAPVEQLYSFAWERDCIQCQAMDFRRYATPVEWRCVPAFRLHLYCPHRPLFSAAAQRSGLYWLPWSEHH